MFHSSSILHRDTIIKEFNLEVAYPIKIDGTPQVLLQALAMAKPVIATLVGGIPKLIADHETGFLIEPQNPASLNQAIHWILKHLPNARAMGHRGGEVVVRNFSTGSCH